MGDRVSPRIRKWGVEVEEFVTTERFDVSHLSSRSSQLLKEERPGLSHVAHMKRGYGRP